MCVIIEFGVAIRVVQSVDFLQGLVIAGASDFARPVESLSLNQSMSLAVTGTLWARYCMVIIPKNYFLCSCNVFLGAVGTTQVARILL